MPRTIYVKNCLHCGEQFSTIERPKQYCNRSCWHASIRTLQEIPCKECGLMFRPPSSRERLCSRACLHNWQKRLFANRVTLTCQQCGKPYEQKPSLQDTSRFCSRACKRVDWYENVRPGMLKSETEPERKIKEALISLNITFSVQFPAGIYLIDFLLPDLNIAIEVDGIYWHSMPGAKERDGRKDDFLKSLGYTPLRITDKSIIRSKDVCLLLRGLLPQD